MRYRVSANAAKPVILVGTCDWKWGAGQEISFEEAIGKK